MACLLFVSTGADQPRARELNTTPPDFTVAFIGDQGPVERPGNRARDTSIWRICSWHRNRQTTQTGRKTSEVGWGPYQACREGRAIIVNAHSHVYNRTKTLRRFHQDGAAASALDPEWPDPDVIRVGEGSTFLAVSGLGGFSSSPQARCLNAVALGGTECPEWASIYTASQNAQFGALFITFHVDGDPFRARGYFKNIDGETVDRFTIHATGLDGSPAAKIN